MKSTANLIEIHALQHTQDGALIRRAEGGGGGGVGIAISGGHFIISRFPLTALVNEWSISEITAAASAAAVAEGGE